MTPEQRRALMDACCTTDEFRIVTCALHIAATAARERRQDTAIAIRHLVDAHQGREQAEKEYKRQRLTMATQILAGLAANPVGPYQDNPRSGWGLCNCDHSQVAGEAIALADSLMVANAVAPIPHDAKESNAAGQPAEGSAAPALLDAGHVCATCGKPATCIGAYEGSTVEEYACDDCCGHGNEDGHCRPLETKP